MKIKISVLEQLQQRVEADMASLGSAWKKPTTRLVGAVSPFPDEAFSSWCERVSLQFKVDRTLVLDRFGIEVPAFWVDAGREQLDIQKIVYLTGIAPKKLLDFNEAENTLMPMPQYAYMTSNPLQPQQTFRYCEQCLQGDEEPYGRRLWRLSFAHICPKHQTVLRDKCPNCNYRIANGYCTGKRVTSLRICCSCGYDLSAASPVSLPARDTLLMLRRQIWWVHLLRAFGSFQGGPEYWYRGYDPHWVHDECGQLSSAIDVKFLSLVHRFTGRLSYAKGERLIVRRSMVAAAFEEKSPHFKMHPAMAYKYYPWRTVFLGGEYEGLANAHEIAKILSRCHDLTNRGDLWHSLKNVPVPKELAEISTGVAHEFQRWFDSDSRSKKRAAKMAAPTVVRKRPQISTW